MTETLISLSERDEWIRVLRYVPHAFGHTWESCYAMSLSTNLNTYLYHLEDNDVHIICSISERTYQGYTDIFTPYGFSGFASNKEHADFPSIWSKFVEKRNYICGYFTMNPFLNTKEGIFDEDAISVNNLYALNLNLSLDQLYANMSLNRKRQLKNHHEILMTFSKEKFSLKSFFLENFHDFFKDRDAALFSSFTRETLSYLLDLDNVFLIGKISNDKIEAVSVFAYTPYVAEYLFNISTPEGRSHAVPLLWEGIKDLKNKGIPLLNLGGGIKIGDTLSQFKERFGAEIYPLKVLKQIYNLNIFQDLCINAGVSDQDSYFPPYRKIVSSNLI